MTAYALYVIDHTEPMGIDEYNARLTGKPDYYFDKLRDVFAFCGGKLHRGRLPGYSGLKGNIEYMAYKVEI